MALQPRVRHKARTVIISTAAFALWASVDASAQGKNNVGQETAPHLSTNSTTSNSSWEQAIAILQAQVDQQAALIAQLQAALTSEAGSRQTADGALQNSIANETAARATADTGLQANMANETAAWRAADSSLLSTITAESAARQQGDAQTLLAAKQYADSVAGGDATLAAAKQYTDSVAATEGGARQTADTNLQNALNALATVRQQGDADTLAAAKQYADGLVGGEVTGRQAADAALQNNIDAEAAARQAAVATLQANIDAIQLTGGGGGTVPQQLLDLAPYLSVQSGTINGLAGPHVILTGVNLHVRSGQPVQYDHTKATFNTASYAANGRGNLIVGYDDDFGHADVASARTGSHNLVVGDGHRFDASGGFLAGFFNYVGVNAGVVSGGYANGAFNFAASVAGGYSNWALGQVSSIGGGYGSLAEGDASSVTGGNDNHAVANYSTVNGGQSNYATGFAATVSGGLSQTASGDYSTAP